jgi:hypothetical protein
MKVKSTLAILAISGLLAFYNSAAQTKVKNKSRHFDIANAPAPLFRDPIYDGAADPTVIWNPQTKEWLIFYTARRAVLELKNVEYCYGTAIGIAASKDFGKTWNYKGTAALSQPDSGLNSFWAPQVFFNPDEMNSTITLSPLG